MKCPKCGYLGFDSGDRCRNCGYEFSLAEPPTGPGARRTPGQGAAGEPSLRDPGLARGSRYRRADMAGHTPGIDRTLAGQPEGTPIELPLFGEGDGPAMLPPPRPPLSVRRATPTPSRLRPRLETPPVEALKLDLDQAPGGQPASRTPVPVELEAPAAIEDVARARHQTVNAPAGKRAAAALIDVALAAAIDAGVLYFTLHLCDLTTNDLHLLPAVPLIAFFVVLNGGYFVLLTGTLGQTLGKMAAGIEVVSDRQGGLDVRRAAWRAGAAVLSLVPAGLGWLIGLVGERRALHDRLAGTRVVRVSGG